MTRAAGVELRGMERLWLGCGGQAGKAGGVATLIYMPA